MESTKPEEDNAMLCNLAQDDHQEQALNGK
jgi:hypothetical protein